MTNPGAVQSENNMGDGCSISPAAKISIIIVNWNGKNDTLECLESLSKIDYPNFDVIVVDNGSSDGSVGAIRSRFPEVIVLEAGKNLGFAGGNNVGIRHAMAAGAGYVFLLNNDTVVDPQVLRKLISAAERTAGGGIFGAKIYSYHEPDRIWYAGAKWTEKDSVFSHIGQGETDEGMAYSVFQETGYACGCALFASAGLIRDVGVMDEKYFLTFEEVDWCYRAKERGFPSYFVPDAIVWHKISTAFGGENSPLFQYFLTRNRLLWAEKHLPLKQRCALYCRIARLTLLCLLPARPRQTVKAPFHKAPRRFLKDYWTTLSAKRGDPYRKASLCAIRDYLFRRFGDCSDAVRVLCRQGAPQRSGQTPASQKVLDPKNLFGGCQ